MLVCHPLRMPLCALHYPYLRNRWVLIWSSLVFFPIATVIINNGLLSRFHTVVCISNSYPVRTVWHALYGITYLFRICIPIVAKCWCATRYVCLYAPSIIHTFAIVGY